MAIEIPGIGTVRPGDAADIGRAMRRASGEAVYLARAAGIPTVRFNRLSTEDQDRIRQAVNWLTCPSRCDR